MSVVTFEGIVEHGQIRLKDDVRLPEKAQVYVIVPGIQFNLHIEQGARVFSPRLAHPEQAADLKMQVIEGVPDASL